jgi:hypothetical protein
MSITIKYGIQSVPFNSEVPVTLGQIQDNATLKAILGYGDNTRGLVYGVEQTRETFIPDGSTLVLETKANCKA